MTSGPRTHAMDTGTYRSYGVNAVQRVDCPLPAFGHRLRRLRRALGMKQSALADAAKVDQATVSRWERGAHVPDRSVQDSVLETLSARRADDSALRRLVETSTDAVHLVEEASHICLAYSKSRAMEWRRRPDSLLGTSLWRFATDEIRQAEFELTDEGWWDAYLPPPKIFRTSAAIHDEITIQAGAILWERLYLADGTPVRLVSGDRGPA